MQEIFADYAREESTVTHDWERRSMMRFRGSVQVLLAVAVLIGSLALYGCPKKPEVMQAAPAPAGPAAATVPAPAAAQPSPQTAETPVTRPAAPAETSVQA